MARDSGWRFRATSVIVPLTQIWSRKAWSILKPFLRSWAALMDVSTRIMSSLIKEAENHSPLVTPQRRLLHLPFGKLLSNLIDFKTIFSALYSFYWLRRWGSSLQLSFGEMIVPSPGASVGAAFLFCWFLPAIYVAVSRTQDYRHHSADVIVGAAIGIFITTVVFLQYYSFQPNKLRKTYPIIDIDSRPISSPRLWYCIKTFYIF